MLLLLPSLYVALAVDVAAATTIATATTAATAYPMVPAGAGTAPAANASVMLLLYLLLQ
jgi:hypothetical protein